MTVQPTRMSAAPAKADSLLSVRKLRKEYRAGQPVLKDITLDFEPRASRRSSGRRARASPR